MKQLESEIERYLVRRVESIGGRCVKFIPDYERGMPDRLILLPQGQVVWCELKRPKGGRVAPSQLVAHEELRRLGFRVALIKTKEEVDQLISDIK